MNKRTTTRKFVLEFTKMSGAGNDFIVVDNRFYFFSADELADLATRFCERRTGIGADGLLALNNPDSDDTHFRMSYYNADGSLGTMCGNGARCLARFAREAGIQSEPLVFGSDAGLYSASVPDEESLVRLFVQPPRDFREAIMLETALETVVETSFSRPAYIWTGTEHVVLFVDDVDAVDVPRVGKSLREDSALQPAGANINFVQVQDDRNLKVRTFEKGVERETLACGTGSIAASFTAALSGRSNSKQFDVHMRGGTLRVGFDGTCDAPQDVFLEGGAETVYRGTLEL